MDTHSRRVRFDLLLQIRKATQSTNSAWYMEGMLAHHFRDSIIQFQKIVRIDDRAIGEIDIELETVIIEVTAGSGGGKVGQVTRLLSSALNPTGKKVIVFGPNITPGRTRAIEAAGAFVAKSLRELDMLVSED